MNGVIRQTEDVLDRAERMTAILENWKEATAKLTPSAAKVVNLLGGNPFVTAKKASETLGIAYNTANRSLVALEKAKILFPANDAKRDRVFVARELLNILEEPVRFGGYQTRKEEQEAATDGQNFDATTKPSQRT